MKEENQDFDKPPSKGQKIKTIYLANVLEGFYRSYQLLPTQKRLFWTRHDTVEGNRAFFYNHDNKAIATAYPINPLHFQSICKLMGWKNVINLTPLHPSSSICEDCLNDQQLKKQLTMVLNDNPYIDLIPYRATPEFHRLIASLKKKGFKIATPETIPPEKEFVTTYSHCKRGFRHLWSKAVCNIPYLNIDIPEGFITGNKEEAIEASWWFQQQKRSFVIKYNKGTQGIGVMIFLYYRLPKTKKEFMKQMKSNFQDKIWHEPSIVVEEYIEKNPQILGGSPSIELFINQHGQVIPTYACEQILASDKKTFLGVYINKQVRNHPYIETAFTAGKLFGKEIARLGYRGYFDIDLVISKKNKIFAVESNMRRTGGTHVNEAAIALLGRNYLAKYHVASEDIMLGNEIELNYETCINLFKDLLFNKKSKTGLLLCNPDMLTIDILNVILITKSRNALYHLRNEVKKRLTELQKN